ncbi:MAG: hypothetical protein AAF957_02575 [Planctomycetota bacterium]
MTTTPKGTPGPQDHREEDGPKDAASAAGAAPPRGAVAAALHRLDTTLDALIDWMSDDDLGLAVERYFGDADVLFEFGADPLGALASAAFFEWAVGDHRRDDREPTAAESALGVDAWSPVQRAAFAARRDAILGLYRVEQGVHRADAGGPANEAACSSVGGLDARIVDVTTGEFSAAFVPGLSHADVGAVHPLRVLVVERVRVAVVAGPALRAGGVESHASSLAASGPVALSRRLRLEGARMGDLWLDAHAVASPPVAAVSSPKEA